MPLTINVGTTPTNVISQLKTKSLKIIRLSSTKNTFTAKFNWFSDSSPADYSFKVGEEIIVADGSTTLFGGIIQACPKVRLGPGIYEYTLFCTGYEQILSRRTISVANYSGTCGDLAELIATNYLITTSDTSEGMSLGTFDDGTDLTNLNEAIISISKLYDTLAKASGFKWWVDDDKEINFTKEPTITQAPYDLFQATGDARRLNDVRNPSNSPDLSNFRNKQFFVGKGQSGQVLFGSAEDSASVTEMATRYGSGVHGSIEYDSKVETYTEANEAAAALLQKHKNEPNQFIFQTEETGFDINQYFDCTWPELDISTETRFVISKIIIRDKGRFLLYEVYADERIEIVGEDYVNAPPMVWTEKFGKMSTSEEGLGSPDSGATDTYSVYVFEEHTDTNPTDLTNAAPLTLEAEAIISFPAHAFFDVSLTGTNGTYSTTPIEITCEVYKEVWNGTSYDTPTLEQTFTFVGHSTLDQSWHIRHPFKDLQVGTYRFSAKLLIGSGNTFTINDDNDFRVWITSQGIKAANGDYVPLPDPPVPGPEGYFIEQLDYITHESSYDGNYNDLIWLDDTHCMLAYYSNVLKQSIKVFSVDSNYDLTLVDSLDLTARGEWTSLIQLSSTMFVCVYTSSGNQYYDVFTMDGSYNLTFLNYNTFISDLDQQSLVRIDDTHFITAQRGADSDGFIRTYSVDGLGVLTQEDALEHDTAFGSYNKLARVSDSNLYVLAYRGGTGGHSIKTFTVDGSYEITEVASYKHETINGSRQSLVMIDDTHFALAYDRGSDGIVKTFSMDSDGTNIAEIDSIVEAMGFDEPSLVLIDSTHLALALRGTDNDGYINTYSFDESYDNLTEIVSFEHQSGAGYYNAMIMQDISHLTLAYGGSTSGYMKTFGLIEEP